MTANQALNELDKFPAFRAELARALEFSRELATNPAKLVYAGEILIVMQRLGSMLAVRDAVDSSGERRPSTRAALAHLVRLMEPLERDGTLNIPGLATLNGAREALAVQLS